MEREQDHDAHARAGQEEARGFGRRWLQRDMLSPMSYRLLVLAAMVVCALVYGQAVGVARAEDGAEGLTLLLAGRPMLAALVVLLLTAAALAVALAVTIVGRPGTGVLAMAVGLAFAVGSAGPIEPWLRRAEGTGLYWFFAAETLAWTALWLAVMLVVYQFNAFLQRLAPERAEGVPEGAAEVPEPAWWGAADAMEGRSGAAAELLAAAVCIAIGSVGVAVLVRTADTAQAMWGVGISYAVAGLIAHQVSPVRNPVVFVLSPLAAAIGWYVYIALHGVDANTLLYNYFGSTYWPAGLVMPAQYASAGVAGVLLGRAWSNAMLRQHWLGME